MQRVLEQTPPLYPSVDFEMLTDSYGYLRDFTRSKASKIVHVRCDTDTRSISEQCRNYLNREKGNRQVLTYFAFNAHDIRFNSVLSMFASMFSHFFQHRNLSPEIDRWITRLALPRWWRNDRLNFCWHRLRQERFIADALLVLGSFDECYESEALWFLSEIRHTMETTEGDGGRLKVVVVTSKNTKLGGKIAGALSKLPREMVTTISHAQSTKSPSQGGILMSKLLLKYPELAEPLAAADVTRLTKMCGHDPDLSKLLYKLIQDKPVAEQTEDRLLSFLGPTFEQILEQVLGEILVKSRGWARRVLTFILTALRPLRVHEFYTVSELCARFDDPAYKPKWLTRSSSSTNHEVVKLLQSLRGLLSVKDDEIHFSHPYLRMWLMSEGSSHNMASRPWYRIGSEIDGHLNVFEISLAHLQDLPAADSYYPLLPYAIEHWASHYKLAASLESDALVRNLFNNQGALEFWLDAYTSISSSRTKPLPETRTPLCVAAHFGLDNIIEYFLDHTAGSGYTQDWEKATLEALRAGELSVFRLLFQGAPRPLEFEDSFLQNAVLEASNSGHVQVFREIVGHIPKARHPIPDWDSIRRSHIVEIASDQGIERIASNALEESGSDDSPDAPFRWLATALTNACGSGADDITNTLLQLGANPNSTDPTGFSALAMACWQGSHRMVKMLLQQGADPEKPSGPKRALPLFCAVLGGSSEAVRLLLENGASAATKDERGLLPLQAACWHGRFDAAETILRYMPLKDIDSQTDNPLLVAVSSGSYKITEALLRHGVSPDCHENPGSALGMAIFSGRYDLCKLLLDYKADLNISHQSQPPLVVAGRGGNLDIITLLIRNGADVNKAWESGDFVRPPLSLAVANGQVDVARILLENGANPNAVDGRDYSALLLAASRGVIPTKTHHIKGSG